MADTQKIIDQSTAVEQGSNFVPPSNKEQLQHKRKVATVWKYIGKIALLLYTIVVFARVPFIGSYVDGLFDYLFGFGKYIFYGLAIFAEIGWMFNTGYSRIVQDKRFFIFSFIGLIAACCIVSGVTGLLVTTMKEIQGFNVIMTNYHNAWFSYFTSWRYDSFFNFYVTGGIFGELIGYLFTFLSFIVLIVVSAIVLIICILLILNVNYRTTRVGLKLRGWLIRKLGGTFKYDGYNELKSKRDNQNKFRKKKRTEVEAVALASGSLPYNMLPNTDVNRHSANFKRARHLQNRLVTLFKNCNIDCVPTDINVYSSFSEICFEAKNKQEIKTILQLQPRIAKVMKLDHFNISLRGNIINIEIDNIYFSKLCLRTMFELYNDGKDLTAVFGINKDGALATQNFRNNPSSLIIGKKGSGSSTLAVLMTLSMCYITNPDKLDLIVLNPNVESTYSYFSNLPHSEGRVCDSITLCTDKLHEIQRTVNERISLLKVNNVNTIDQYNRTVGNLQPKIKHILVLIANFDSLIKETFQNNKILTDILEHGQKAGVYLILQSYMANNDVLDKDIFDNVSDKYILALNSQEESMKIFDNHRGYQLHSNGDCLHFGDNKIGNMKRLQIANINYAELTADIDVIATFYGMRLKQREEKILSEARENETN